MDSYPADFVPDYLLIGHFTADLGRAGQRTLGGTVGYAAKTAHAFGLRVGIVTSAKPDDPLLDELRGIATLHLLPAEATTTFENVYTATERVQYVRGFAAHITASDIPPAWRDAPLVHFAPIAGELDDAQVMQQFTHTQTLLTLQGMLRRWEHDGRVRFRYWCDETAIQACQMLVLSEEDIPEAPELEQKYTAAVHHVLVTRADKGGTYYCRGQAETYGTPQVQVTEQTGAGDVFAAALLASLPLTDGDMHKAIAIAARLGALAVTRQGLHGTPNPDEVQAVLQEVKANA